MYRGQLIYTPHDDFERINFHPTVRCFTAAQQALKKPVDFNKREREIFAKHTEESKSSDTIGASL